MVHVADIRRPIEEEFRLYERAFEESVAGDNPLLEQVWSYVLSKQGKQLRPLLVLLSAAACRGVTDKTLHTAVALELLHTASLIHDDVVDNSPLRRGAESVHARWTNKIAVLAGDYILAKVIAGMERTRNQKITNIISRVGASLSSGELLQLHAGSSIWISEKQYYRIIEQKTAVLFSACAEAGAESSGGTAKQVTALRRYGLHLGMCFQLKDDVLDYGDSEEIGKPTMGDIRDGKATLPLLTALSRAPKQEAEAIRHLCENMQAKDEQEVQNFVIRYGGIQYTYNQMQAHRSKAQEALLALPESPFRRSLQLLADYAISRDK